MYVDKTFRFLFLVPDQNLPDEEDYTLQRERLKGKIPLESRDV